MAKNATPPSQGQHSHEGEHHGDFGKDDVKITRSTYIFALCAALNSCNLGYDIGVSTNAGHLIETDLGLTTAQREIFVGSINFWAIFGGLGSQYFTDKYGRRRTFLVAALTFIVGVIITAAGQTYGVLMFGRFFVGLGVGVGLAIDPMYIAEMTPAKHRGEMVTYAEIFLNIGIVLGFATGIVFSGLADDVEWRVMVALGAVLPVVMIYLVCCVMPDTPRWLVAQNRDVDAKQVLEKIYPAGYNVDPILKDIRVDLEVEEAAEKTVGWGVIFKPTPAYRRMLLSGVGIAVAQQAVGIDAIQYYLLDVLDKSGIRSENVRNVVLVVLGLIKLVFIFVGGKLFDKRGRRPLIFASLVGMAAALLVISIAFYASGDRLSTGFVVVALAFYLAFFSIGMGPGAWLIPSEVFATCIRAKAMSVATTLNRVTATLMSATFLSTANAMGWGGFFMMLAAICVVVVSFVYLEIPETKGRSLEDMTLYFAEITGDQSVLEAEAAIAERRGSTEMTSTRGAPRLTAEEAEVV